MKGALSARITPCVVEVIEIALVHFLGLSARLTNDPAEFGRSSGQSAHVLALDP